MVTTAQLETEPAYLAEKVSAAMTACVQRWQSHWHVGWAVIGCKGDNRHLRGRHRSRNWTRTSQYCTDRGYGDTDPRDHNAPAEYGDYLRAFDIDGMPATERYAFTRALDTAVRAGRLPCVAEWFGTFDGTTVVGWFQGHPSSSDSSHLEHTHIGIWTSSVTDAAQIDLLCQIILGEDEQDMTPEQANQLAEVHSLITTGKRLGPAQTADGGVPIADEQRQFYDLDNAVAAAIKGTNELRSIVEAQATDIAAIRQAVAEPAAVTADMVAAALQRPEVLAAIAGALGPRIDGQVEKAIESAHLDVPDDLPNG